MKILMTLYLTLVELVNGVGSLCRKAWKKLIRSGRSEARLAEAERIDRICHPSKYLGKP